IATATAAIDELGGRALVVGLSLRGDRGPGPPRGGAERGGGAGAGGGGGPPGGGGRGPLYPPTRGGGAPPAAPHPPPRARVPAHPAHPGLRVADGGRDERRGHAAGGRRRDRDEAACAAVPLPGPGVADQWRAGPVPR